ncbi:hypothetical protein PUN28_012108 [Cardiocondyla obscurior]|uniref:Uncharacterized protein n=1 Tax=Cardiocondyla obscurior TaxID=286306 RepID=A0AAW2FDD3_9HYME
MEFQEKFAFTRESPTYDAIPLIIIDKMKKKYPTGEAENLKYYVPSPFWMKFRLLLFWTLWAALIFAIIICFLTYFCFIPRMCRNLNTFRNAYN